ncbi:hypothetical protein [Nocardioides sp.]|uniref:hypothetical protein n=1 Tax=Nocardioides sp. TaxID=35761 RepID=UPI003562A1A5
MARQSPTPAGAQQTKITRRRVVTTAGHAAWATPLIVAASAAPATASSGTGAPAVVASDVGGVRRPEFGGIVDCSISFTNNGAAATALSVDVDFAVIVPGTSVAHGVSDVSSPWMSGPPTVTPGGFRVTFTRAGGLGAGADDTLTFTINSAQGTGNILVSPPVTSPTGANTGATGVWGDAMPSPVDMDVTGLNVTNGLGEVNVSIKNNGTVAAATQTVEVTITPTSGTFSYSNLSANNPSNWVVSPVSVGPTSNPTTLEFTSPTPLTPGNTTVFSFHIDETGTGTVSATVTDPASPNNNSRSVTYS